MKRGCGFCACHKLEKAGVASVLPSRVKDHIGYYACKEHKKGDVSSEPVRSIKGGCGLCIDQSVILKEV